MWATIVAAVVVTLAGGSVRRGVLPLHSCSPQGVSARCGTLLVRENRARPDARRIGLKFVVIPAVQQPAAPDAFTYLAGGPGGAAASDMPSSAVAIWSDVHQRHDIVLVDQRGTGGSHALVCPDPKRMLSTDAERRAYVRVCLLKLKSDPNHYGTRDAVADLEAVRRALGYATFDIYGTSYGGTVAQMYLKRFPRSVRTLVLDGATFTDVPFYARFAANGQRALSLVERECKAQPTCARAFPHWREELDTLIEQWNETPMKLASGSTLSGDDLASIVQQMLLTADTAASIPLLVSRAAAGDVGPLATARAASGGVSHSLMYWTIMCNEPWVGRDARGPWRTFLDGATSASLTQLRSVCPYIPGHAEPLSTWRRVHSNVPTLVLAGQADPQDPIGNLPGLATALPRSRVVIAPAQGHAVGQYGCLGALVGRFVSRGSAQHLDTRCARSLRPSVFFTR